LSLVAALGKCCGSRPFILLLFVRWLSDWRRRRRRGEGGFFAAAVTAAVLGLVDANEGAHYLQRGEGSS
jgi:hypothetical protein